MLRYTLIERGSRQIANSIMKTSSNVKKEQVKPEKKKESGDEKVNKK